MNYNQLFVSDGNIIGVKKNWAWKFHIQSLTIFPSSNHSFAVSKFFNIGMSLSNFNLFSSCLKPEKRERVNWHQTGGCQNIKRTKRELEKVCVRRVQAWLPWESKFYPGRFTWRLKYMKIERLRTSNVLKGGDRRAFDFSLQYFQGHKNIGMFVYK